MKEDDLERVYQENLEERIISFLARTKGVSLEQAMRIYYNSKLADKIHRGDYGVQYLDYKVLVEILCETEQELIKSIMSESYMETAWEGVTKS